MLRSGYFSNSYFNKIDRDAIVDKIKKEKSKSKKISKARKGKKYKKRAVGRPSGDKTIPNIVGQKAGLSGGNVYVVSAKRGKYKKGLFNQKKIGGGMRGTFTPLQPKGGWTGWTKENTETYNKRRRSDEVRTLEAVKYGRELEKQKAINKQQEDTLKKLKSAQKIQAEGMAAIIAIQERERGRDSRVRSVSPRSRSRSASISSQGSNITDIATDEQDYYSRQEGRIKSKIEGLTEYIEGKRDEGKFTESTQEALRPAYQTLREVIYEPLAEAEVIMGGLEGVKERSKEFKSKIKEQKKDLKRLPKDERKRRKLELETQLSQRKEQEEREKTIIKQGKLAQSGAAITDPYYVPRGRTKLTKEENALRRRVEFLKKKEEEEEFLSRREQDELEEKERQIDRGLEQSRGERRTEQETSRLMSIGGGSGVFDTYPSPESFDDVEQAVSESRVGGNFQNIMRSWEQRQAEEQP